MKRRKLTLKQKNFVHYYILTGNATKSAVKAKYSPRSARYAGSNLLTNPNVLRELKRRQKKLDTHRIASEKEIEEDYTKILRGQMTEDAVGALPDSQKGYYKAKKRPDVKERLNAGKELMKRYDPNSLAKLAKTKAEANIKQIEAKQMSTSNNKQASQMERVLKSFEIPDNDDNDHKE